MCLFSRIANHLTCCPLLFIMFDLWLEYTGKQYKLQFYIFRPYRISQYWIDTYILVHVTEIPLSVVG